MLRTATLTTGGLLLATIALAAADIPARYVGPFPSDRFITNITGVFAGKSLTLKYTVVRSGGARFFPTTASYTCVVVPPDMTDCTGRFKTDDGQLAGKTQVQITWKAGQPVATVFPSK